MSDEDKHKAAALMYGDGHDEAVQLLDKALGGSDAPVEEAQLDEAVPLAAAAIWIIKFIAMRGAWPVLKWLLKKYGGKLAVGSVAVYYIDQGWDWVKEAIGEEYAQMLIDNKFEIGMAVALILGAVALKKFIEKKGDKLVKANEKLVNATESVSVEPSNYNESDVVVDKASLVPYIKNLIMGYLDKEQDVEKLSKLLKMMVGREIKARGGKRYTITREDISLALTK
jgi:hypothetical protein